MGDTVKRVVAVLGVLAGVAIACSPIEGLSSQACCALGVLVWAIVWWILCILPELVVALVMAVLFVVATVILWALEPIHGISSTAVVLVALAAIFVAGIYGFSEFRSGMNWEMLLFIGIAMGLTSVFSATGIDEWVISLVGPVIEHLAFSPYVFVVGIGIATVLLRFVIVSEMAYVNIFMAFMVPMAVSFGINPWIVGFTVYATVNPWFAFYQNPIYMAAFYAVDGKMVKHADMAKYCVLYLAICILALAVSVPYWQAIGIYSL